MKIRSGFVSNSSSSSFLCEICGDCWDSDHSPSIVGGLCEACHEVHEICNCCGNVFRKSELFITKNIELQRGGDPVGDHDEEDRADWTSWDTTMTCARCLTMHAEMVEAWISNNQHQEWVKKVSNPTYNIQEVDTILTEALLKHNR